MSDSFNVPGKCESLTDCSNCSVDCLSTPVSEVSLVGKHCNYLGVDMCPGLINKEGVCDYCGSDYIHKFTPSQLLNDIRMHNSDKMATTNNTFIQRYLETRHPNSPKREELREDLDSAAFDLL